MEQDIDKTTMPRRAALLAAGAAAALPGVAIPAKGSGALGAGTRRNVLAGAA